MDPTTKNPATTTPVKTPQSNRSKPRDSENINPNLKIPNPKPSRSPANKSVAKTLIKSASKNPNPKPSVFSPKNKIRERKFVVVAKRNSKKEKKNLLEAYETLRASQEEFFKSGAEIGIKEDEIEANGVKIDDPDEVSGLEKMGHDLNSKRRRDFGSGKVMSLVKAFERLHTNEADQKKGEEELEINDEKGLKLGLDVKDPETQISSSSICPSDFLLGSESLVSSSLDSSQGSFTFSSKGSCVGRRSRRNSVESCGTYGGRRWRKKQQLRATRQQPFKLLTEQRGRSKEEEFIKKVQEMMIEEEKLRIPLAQGLPLTTDEPENLVKPPVKETTMPVDLVLHSDIRAVDRADFDQQFAEKMALYEQIRMERERQQKLAEEEEIRRLRKELVPKAQPMPYFDRPFIPRRSLKHPTIPREPKLHIPEHKKIKSCLSWNDISSFQHQ